MLVNKKAIVIFKEDGNFFSRKLSDQLVFLLKNVKLQPATPIALIRSLSPSVSWRSGT
jgi:hypothetical protein